MRQLLRSYLLLVSAFICACSSPADKREPRILLDSRVASELWVSHGLTLCGIGGESDHGDPPKSVQIYFHFEVAEILTLTKARCLIVSAMDEIISIVNHSGYAQSQLITAPCTEQHVWLTIRAVGPNNCMLLDPNICYISADRGCVSYGSKLTPQGYGCQKKVTESWEDAVRIAREQDQHDNDLP